MAYCKRKSKKEKGLKPMTEAALKPYFRTISVTVYDLLPHLNANLAALTFILNDLKTRLSSDDVEGDLKPPVAAEIIKTLIKKNLPNLFIKFVQMHKQLEEEKENDDDDDDANVVFNVKLSYKSVVNVLELLISCIEIFATKHPKKFQGAMGAGAKVEFFHALAKFFDPIPSLTYAMGLFKLLESLVIVTGQSKEAYRLLAPLVTSLKDGNYQVRDKSKCVSFILEQEIKVCKWNDTSETLLECMYCYIADVLPGFIGRDEQILEQHPLLNSETFPIFHRVIFICI
ncbi:MAG: hypothetical protein RIR48_1942 [Bacteroidota bacterium]